jgi:serine/threonine protein kinase
MSPEQCDGIDLTPAADVYSLGCILYEMLTGTVPFSGSTPLAIAMKHLSEAPRSLSEFAPNIPLPLERVVLHALEKRPQDRPANAAEFRKELLTTAESLGLEHAAVTSSPNLAALRSVGTESPSGRLVIDIARLRETRASSNDSGEMTAIRPAALGRGSDGRKDGSNVPAPKLAFPRISLSLDASDRTKKQIKIVAVVIAAAIIIGIALVVRSRNAIAPAAAAVEVASPSPTVEPSSSPSPSPSPSPPPAAKAPAKKPAAQPKKESKVGAVVNKVKRFLKKPF